MIASSSKISPSLQGNTKITTLILEAMQWEHLCEYMAVVGDLHEPATRNYEFLYIISVSVSYLVPNNQQQIKMMKVYRIIPARPTLHLLKPQPVIPVLKTNTFLFATTMCLVEGMEYFSSQSGYILMKS